MATLKSGRAAKLDVLAAAAIGCGSTGTAGAAARVDAASAVYVAKLHPLNTSIAGGDTTGKAQITVRGDALTITLRVNSAPPGIEHWQHFHGFADGRAAACRTAAADVNHDGVIEFIERKPRPGRRCCLLTVRRLRWRSQAKPIQRLLPRVALATVALTALQAAFAKAFNGQSLGLDHRVIFIHGVPKTDKLAASVASLGSIPSPAVESNG